MRPISVAGDRGRRCERALLLRTLDLARCGARRAASRRVTATAAATASRPIELAGGLDQFGNREGGWCFDNELAVHKAWLDPFAVSDRLVTNRDYLEFMSDGGYRDPLLWLANGWAAVRDRGDHGAALLGAGRRRVAAVDARRACGRWSSTSRSVT